MVIGPSGGGKGTVCAELRRRCREPFYSISATTRAPRDGEVDGVSYHFVDRDWFEAAIKAGELLEYACVHGRDFYGTPKGPVEAALAQGRHVVLEIDIQGARQVKELLPEAQLVFLAPPSWPELEQRLRNRGTEDEDAIRTRLKTAEVEMAAADVADHIVVNSSVGQTVAALVSLLGLTISDPEDEACEHSA